MDQPATPQPRLTLADLAKILGLAPSTVSRALAGNTQVSELTRQRVQAKAAELNYHPNRLAAALRKGQSRTLGVLVPHLSGSFFPEVVNGVALEASHEGFNVMICQSNEDAEQERRNIELLLDAQVEGILVSLSKTTHSYAHFEDVRGLAVPLVFFDRIVPEMVGGQVRTVRIDDYAGAYAAVQHLIEQGCRRIAHLAGPRHLHIHQHRTQGYCDALRDNGLPFDADLMYHDDALTREAGATGIGRLLHLSPPPDAVFAASDEAAVGAMRALKAQGLRVPADVAVVGFSNDPFTALTEPSITTVDQRCQLMGKLAVRTLLAMVRREWPANQQPAEVVLKPELLVRESSLRRADV